MKLKLLIIALLCSNLALGQAKNDSITKPDNIKTTLSSEERNKIWQQETYRNEVQRKLKTESKWDFENIIKILQGLAIIAGIAATYFAYRKQIQDRLDQEKARNDQFAKDFKSSFYKAQFQLYVEACDVAATLATEDMHSKEYEDAKTKFYRLFWGRLAIVEDRTIEKQMLKIDRLLSDYEKGLPNASQGHLEQASLKLARLARQYTINVWLDSAERENYNTD